MTSFFNFGRFKPQARPPPPAIQSQQPAATPSQNGQSPTTLTTPTVAQVPLSPPPTSNNLVERTVSTENNMQSNSPAPRQRPPFYFRPDYADLTVKGNFMTLATKPEHVDKGEWLAHQVVEQYRLLECNMKVVQEADSRTGQPLCNPHNCPQMTAPNNTVYTWLDNQKNPIRIPASQYMSLVQKWIMTKIQDPKLFPTDPNFALPTGTSTYPTTSGAATPIQGQPIPAGPTSLTASLTKLSGQERDWLGKGAGFPESFQNDIRSLYRQMFRCYAHLYYAHWIEPFHYLGLVKELNTCFIHFINVGREFDLLAERDLTPMMPLINIWIGNKLLPPSTVSQPASAVQTPVAEQAREVQMAAA